jgi:hypothetical protein
MSGEGGGKALPDVGGGSSADTSSGIEEFLPAPVIEMLPIVKLPVMPTALLTPLNQHYVFVIALEGINYVFHFYWLPDSGWYFDVRQADRERTLLVAGLGLVCGVDLLYAYKHDFRLPQGVLFVRDIYNSGVDPMADDAFMTGAYDLCYQHAPSGDQPTPVRLTPEIIP